jgi:hypothetical protein
MTPKQRKRRGVPKATSIPERYRLLGERLGVPYPVPRNGSWDAGMDERWNRWVDVVGLKLIRMQPEFRNQGRRPAIRPPVHRQGITQEIRAA